METFRSLVALLARRAAEQADDRAYVFVSDRGAEEAVLSFRQLHDAAGALDLKGVGLGISIIHAAGLSNDAGFKEDSFG